MRRFFIAFLVIAALAIGGGFIANTAYQAGLSANVTVLGAGVDAADGTVVAPVVVPGYGYGYGWGGWGPGFGHGFSIFGLLGTLFVLFLLIGLIRAFGFRGRGGWGGPGGWGGQGGPGASHPWETRARERHDEWHRTAHDATGDSPDPATPTSGSPA